VVVVVVVVAAVAVAAQLPMSYQKEGRMVVSATQLNCLCAVFVGPSASGMDPINCKRNIKSRCLPINLKQ